MSLMFWYDADWGGRWERGCKEVCCVYSVQIIACFSAFSLELPQKEKKKTQLQHSHTITQEKKITSVLSMLSGVKKLLHTSC